MSPTKLQKRDIAELRKLEKAGRLNKEDVVKAAANPKNPLHRHFTWNDSKCGILYRLDESLALIESYKLEIVVDDVVVEPPMYVRDPSKAGNEAGHIALTKLQQDRRLALLALKSEAQRVRSSLERAHNIAIAVGLKEELDEMLSDVLVRAERLLKAA